MNIANHENQPVEMLVSVTHQRVAHYADVVEFIVNNEVSRCKSEGYNPTSSQIEFLRKEAVRYAIIRQDIVTAQSLRIRRTTLLSE